MTFAEIDLRLDLYPEYLKYFVDKRVVEITYAVDLMRNFRLTGCLYYEWLEFNRILSFDEWGWTKGYWELSEQVPKEDLPLLNFMKHKPLMFNLENKKLSSPPIPDTIRRSIYW